MRTRHVFVNLSSVSHFKSNDSAVDQFFYSQLVLKKIIDSMLPSLLLDPLQLLLKPDIASGPDSDSAVMVSHHVMLHMRNLVKDMNKGFQLQNATVTGSAGLKRQKPMIM
jgi:hypothetical protein